MNTVRGVAYTNTHPRRPVISGGGRGWVDDGGASEERERFPVACLASFSGPWPDPSCGGRSGGGPNEAIDDGRVVVADHGTVLSLRVDQKGGKTGE
jgi:hypothetical protein